MSERGSFQLEPPIHHKLVNALMKLRVTESALADVNYVLNRYPVLKIYQIATRQITRNTTIMLTLTSTLTSAARTSGSH